MGAGGAEATKAGASEVAGTSEGLAEASEGVAGTSEVPPTEMRHTLVMLALTSADFQCHLRCDLASIVKAVNVLSSTKT